MEPPSLHSHFHRRFVLATTLALVAAALPAAQPAAPTPRSVIGWEPCADYKLATYEQLEDYFRKLAAAVPGRMRLVDIGKTSEGRVQVMGIISSEQNLRELDKYKEVSRTAAAG